MYIKIKQLLSDDAFFYSMLILLVGVSSFGLGKYTAVSPQQSHEASIVLTENRIPPPETKTVSAEETQYVASKNGSKYHLLTCPGAKQIKEENKIFFASEDAAKSAGYSRAANCKF